MSTNLNMNNSISLSGTQDNNAQILNDIQSLQDIEQQLFNSLEEKQNLTPSQQEQIIKKINDISNMRINLYQTLSNVNNYFSTTLSNSRGTLSEQTTAIGIVESELNKSKERLRLLEVEKNNKIRLIEINNYFGEKYAEHSDLMKIIVCVLFPVLILAILNKKGFLPNTFYYILIVIIIVIGSVFFWRRFFSIVSRDSMNYQEYAWGFDPNSAPQPSSITSSDPWSVNMGPLPGTCVGDACCSTGLTWDASLNQCSIPTSSTSTSNSSSSSSIATNAAPITNSSSGQTQESFVNNILTKSAGNFKKPDIMLGTQNIVPSEGNSFIHTGKF
jgi:hypothetical protein